MGKYSNVAYSNLKAAATSALAELEQLSLYDVISYINNKSILEAKVANELGTSLSNIETSLAILGSIATIKKKLNNLENAAIYIGKYQELEKTNRELETRRYSYEESLGEDGKVTRTKKVNAGVVNQINANSELMIKYESIIDNYLKVG